MKKLKDRLQMTGIFLYATILCWMFGKEMVLYIIEDEVLRRYGMSKEDMDQNND